MKSKEEHQYMIDKYMAKDEASNPPDKRQSRQEVENYIDERVRQGKHIKYPAAGILWNQTEWERSRMVSKFIENKFPKALLVEPYYKKSRLIQKVILSDGTQEIIAYDSASETVKIIDTGDDIVMGNLLPTFDEPINKISNVRYKKAFLDGKMTSILVECSCLSEEEQKKKFGSVVTVYE